MIIVDHVIVSEDIFDKKFACQVALCKGACCVQGDAGAPLEQEEIEILQAELENIKPFIEPEGRGLIEAEGFWENDQEGELATKCRPTGECVFVSFQNGIAGCGIENAYNAGRTWFRKPLSCHLYPIRAKKYGEYTALNYHSWDICADACHAGNQSGIPVYSFLEDALTRKFGKSWFKKLRETAEDSIKSIK